MTYHLLVWTNQSLSNKGSAIWTRNKTDRNRWWKPDEKRKPTGKHADSSFANSATSMDSRSSTHSGFYSQIRENNSKYLIAIF